MALLQRTVLLAVIGLILVLFGVAIRHDGAAHRASYQAFQRCVAAQLTPVCILPDDGSGAAGSVRMFRENYERQLLIGIAAMAAGAVALLLAGISLAVRRRTRQPPGDVRPPPTGTDNRDAVAEPTPEDLERLQREQRERRDAISAVGAARALQREGLAQEAAGAYQQVIDRFGASPGAWSQVWTALSERHSLLRDLGRDTEADAVFQARLALAEGKDPPDEKLVVILFHGRAEDAFLRGRFGDAAHWCASIRTRWRDRPEFAFDVLQAYHGEGQALAALGHHAAAMSLAREAAALAGQHTASGLTFRLQEARVLESLGRYEEVLTACQGIDDAYRDVRSQQDPRGYDHSFALQSRAAEAMILAADVLARQGNRTAALETYGGVATEFEYAHAESFDVADDDARRCASTARQKIDRLLADPLD